MELNESGELTGRDVGGLHESLTDNEVAEREVHKIIF